MTPRIPRIDGRTPDQLREVRIVPNVLRHAEGSCEIHWGRNRILCAASIDGTVPKWMAGQGKGWLTAEYAMHPRASRQRIERDANRSKPNARALEIQRIIGRSLRAAIDLKALGERTVTIDCDVIEADGGTRTASITGSYVALALAIANMREQQQIARSAVLLREPVAAVSVGMVEGRPVLDLNYLEDSQAEADMNVVMTASGRFIEVQGTAEAAPFSPEEFTQMLALARKGITELVALQRSVVADDAAMSTSI